MSLHETCCMKKGQKLVQHHAVSSESLHVVLEVVNPSALGFLFKVLKPSPVSVSHL